MRIAAIVFTFVFTTATLAGPTTQPLDAPSTQPVKFPTPQELVEKLKQRQTDEKTRQEQQIRVAHIALDQPVVEQNSDLGLLNTGGYALREVVDRLYKARDDKDVRAVLVTLGSTSFNLAQAQEMRDALLEVRRAGKETFVYADSFNTLSYTLASVATNICMLEGGQIELPGVGMETMFLKGALDLVGVQADMVQVGEYKGADEQYTRSAPSEELKQEMNKIADSMYDQIVSGISLHRNLSSEQVKRIIDDVMISGASARQRGLVDHLVDIDGLRELMKEELGDDVVLLDSYAAKEAESLDLSNPFTLLQMLGQQQTAMSGGPTIAVIYVDGVISDGKGGTELLGGTVTGSDDIREALRFARRDPNVKAVVIRIDSPGGSALASEVIWQAARRVAAEKPVVVSIGATAASGGYYIASASNHIIADPSAIVGSIGVVGGKMVTKDLFAKIGVSTESFSRGRDADLFSSNQPFTDRQRRLVLNWMKETYDTFTQRILETRKDKIADIDKVARGRVFLAQQARELGMIDEIGGLHTAIAHAAKEGKLEPGKYEVRTLPAPRSLLESLVGSGLGAESPAGTARPSVAENSVLRALSPNVRKMLLQQVQVMQLMQEHPVMVVSPFVVGVR